MWRNKRGLVSIFVNAVFISLLMTAVFFKAGRYPLVANIYIDNRDRGDRHAEGAVLAEMEQYTSNVMGVALMVSNQISMSGSINAILQIPLQAPVMRRELANKMYSPTQYLLGRFISNMLIQMAYPVIMIVLMFWALEISTTAENFFWCIAYGMLSNMIFCG